MTEDDKTVLTQKDNEDTQFVILCDYNDIITSKSIIVSNDLQNEFFLYSVIEPFPSCETYCNGEEFEEGELISIHKTWQEAKDAQKRRQL